jgi:phasin family protein
LSRAGGALRPAAGAPAMPPHDSAPDPATALVFTRGKPNVASVAEPVRQMERPMAFSPKSMVDFGEFGKLFADMKLPAAPDMEAFVAASRRNMETLTAANRVALEGAQAVGRRHMEIVQQSMAEMTEAVRAMSSIDAPQVKAAKQVELLKQAYEHAVANIKEIGDLIQHSNAEAIKLLNARFVEALDEVKVLAEKSKA